MLVNRIGQTRTLIPLSGLYRSVTPFG